MVLDVQGNDINSAAADSILKSATVALDAGLHSVTVDLSVTWRGYSANPPYLLSPEAVTLDLRWKPVGSSEVVSLSPKSIATP
jgi:hypothetical protein